MDQAAPSNTVAFNEHATANSAALSIELGPLMAGPPLCSSQSAGRTAAILRAKSQLPLRLTVPSQLFPLTLRKTSLPNGAAPIAAPRLSAPSANRRSAILLPRAARALFLPAPATGHALSNSAALRPAHPKLPPR